MAVEDHILCRGLFQLAQCWRDRQTFRTSDSTRLPPKPEPATADYIVLTDAPKVPTHSVILPKDTVVSLTLDEP